MKRFFGVLLMRCTVNNFRIRKYKSRLNGATFEVKTLSQMGVDNLPAVF